MERVEKLEDFDQFFGSTLPRSRSVDIVLCAESARGLRKKYLVESKVVNPESRTGFAWRFRHV